ncbi:hypothetical protein J5N97_011053 [Dioscorea zingiberensis]|uniref:Uncharacterized protein n=1 Tax=Dioscorea zingiberensis TaxID=325984 RepID=A0A9D5D0K9_9LILI|nr:hypothetical protein J5N97_011053 [Dioscorea zingiberensis]
MAAAGVVSAEIPKSAEGGDDLLLSRYRMLDLSTVDGFMDDRSEDACGECFGGGQDADGKRGHGDRAGGEGHLIRLAMVGPLAFYKGLVPNFGLLGRIMGCDHVLNFGTEKMENVKLLDENKTPKLVAWDELFCLDDAMKKVMPQIDKLLEYVKMRVDGGGGGGGGTPSTK